MTVVVADGDETVRTDPVIRGDNFFLRLDYTGPADLPVQLSWYNSGLRGTVDMDPTMSGITPQWFSVALPLAEAGAPLEVDQYVLQACITLNGGSVCSPSSTVDFSMFFWDRETWGPCGQADCRQNSGKQTATVTCFLQTGFDTFDQRGDEDCTEERSGPKPASERPCTDFAKTCQTGTCQDSGICDCPKPFTGDTCAETSTPSITNVVFRPSSPANSDPVTELDVGREYDVSFELSGDDPVGYSVAFLYNPNGSSTSLQLFPAITMTTAIGTARFEMITDGLGLDPGPQFVANITLPTFQHPLSSFGTSVVAVNVYKWQTGDWSTGADPLGGICSGVCGSGTKTRPISCGKASDVAGNNWATESSPICADLLGPGPDPNEPCDNLIEDRQDCQNGGICNSGSCDCSAASGFDGPQCTNPMQQDWVFDSIALSTVPPREIIQIGPGGNTTEVEAGADYQVSWVFTPDQPASNPTVSISIRSSASQAPLDLAANIPVSVQSYTVTLPPIQLGSFELSTTAELIVTVDGFPDVKTIPNLVLYSHHWSDALPPAPCPGSCGSFSRLPILSWCLRQIAGKPETLRVADAFCAQAGQRPTDTSSCSHSASACQNSSTCSASTQSCVCPAHATGPTCSITIPSECNAKSSCINGGFIPEMLGTCQSVCQCSGFWTNPTESGQAGCSECSLVCSPSDSSRLLGKPSPQCTRCHCRRGNRGGSCALTEDYITLKFTSLPPYFVAGQASGESVSDSDFRQQEHYLGLLLEALARGSQLPVTDFSIATWSVSQPTDGNAAILSVTVARHRQSSASIAAFSFGLPLSATVLPTAPAPAPRSRGLRQANPYQPFDLALQALYDDFHTFSTIPTSSQAQFSSPLVEGLTVANSVWDPHCAASDPGCATGPNPFPATEEEFPGLPVDVPDPPDPNPPDPEPAENDGGFPIWIAIVAAVGAVVVIALIIIALCCCARNEVCCWAPPGPAKPPKEKKVKSQKSQKSRPDDDGYDPNQMQGDYEIEEDSYISSMRRSMSFSGNNNDRNVNAGVQLSTQPEPPPGTPRAPTAPQPQLGTPYNPSTLQRNQLY